MFYASIYRNRAKIYKSLYGSTYHAIEHREMPVDICTLRTLINIIEYILKIRIDLTKALTFTPITFTQIK